MPPWSGSPRAHQHPRSWSTTWSGRCVDSARSKYRHFPASRKMWNSGFPPSYCARRRHRRARLDRPLPLAAIVSIPLLQKARIGAYIIRQQLSGRRRYPLVLMLEPLFRCNLACAGCGKIDYPDAILNQRLSVEECVAAADECGAPMVVIAGGEPLLHREIDEIARRMIAKKKFVYLCTNALLLEKKIELFAPSPYFAWTIHLDGDREDHDRSVCQSGFYDRAVAAIKLAKARGFRVNINSTLFDTADPERIARFFDDIMDVGIDGITVSPGYAYERAPDQEHFLNRRRTKELFREIFKRYPRRRWSFDQS